MYGTHFLDALPALPFSARAERTQPLPTALVVEDEEDLAELIAINLQSGGWQTVIAHSVAEAQAAVARKIPDAVLLDRMLPDRSGESFCTELRANEATKQLIVVMLTARGEENDRISGFEAGVDDYVVKPFSARELLLRLEAIIRRSGKRLDDPPLIEVGPLAVNLSEHRTYVNGVETILTVLEFKILHFLLERPGRVCTRNQLMREIWGAEHGSSTRTLDMHVMRLREKLGVERHRVETVRGIGYRLTMSIDRD